MKKVFLMFVCLFTSWMVVGEENLNKDWRVSTQGNDYYYAATVNEDGYIFGKYCYLDEKECRYMIGVDAVCTPRYEYTILINSDSGTERYNLMCGGRIQNAYVLIFDNSEKIEKITMSNTQLTLAIPMRSGQYQSMNFSLLGAQQSIEIMTKAAKKQMILNDIEENYI